MTDTKNQWIRMVGKIEKIDTGDIYSEVEVPIEEAENFRILEDNDEAND